MRTKTCLILAALTGAGQAGAEPGFDERYERGYNIFTPANQYAPDNPLNPANQYNPDVPFGPVEEGRGIRSIR